VSATTRPARTGEIDGTHYHFLSPNEFEEHARAGHFLESATVYDRRYGTLRAPVEEELGRGRSVLLDIDVRGHLQVRQSGLSAIHVMILPPDLATLEARLRARGTDSEETIARRMSQVAEQLRGVDGFDYLVVNDDLGAATEAFVSVLTAQLYRRELHPGLVQRVLASVAGR
jgi:guanylate kinase